VYIIYGVGYRKQTGRKISPVYFLPQSRMDYLKLVKVATRMLLDVVTVLEKKEVDYEIGCKCKDEPTAEALLKIIRNTLEDLPVLVKLKEENVVVIVPTPTSSPDAS
jgi:hypothetical protein